MAKERVTVCLPPCDPDVETWWDYWQIDGGGCEFLVVPGHEEDPRLIRGAETLSGEPRNVPPSLCDGGPRALLDLETPRARAAAEARRAFEAWQEFASAYPPGRAFGDFRARHFADPESYSPVQAVEDYRAQPVIAAFLDNPELEEVVGGDPVARLGDDVDALVRHAMDDVLPSNALLTLEGHWLDVANDARRRYFSDYLVGLPADAYAVRVLYHG
ncbi:hypothetical protein ABZX77_49600 [Streptomyces sp. NPDC004237]|uniref:hypothetical protein n=1 Tax=Streptomyces sp. NPDC004237 TaxID=3154455 RepID=UPI0033A923BE